MIKQLVYELSCLPMRFNAWKNKKMIGIMKKDGTVKIYDYRKKKQSVK